MKKLNSRCPLQGECERVCKYERRELDCDYYDANARPGLMIEDQEAIREKKYADREYELHEDEKDDTEYKCGSCSVGHWYSGEYTHVSVVTPSGGTEKRPCEPHTHYCSSFYEGQRKIAGDDDFDPEDAPGWCPRWAEDRLKEKAGSHKPLISLKKESEIPELAAPERTIQAVTLEIRTLHRQAQQVILGYAIEIGRRLVEAKAMLNHGQWGDWLKNEVEFSQRTANDFMRIFEEYGSSQLGLFGGETNSQTFANLNCSKALRLLAVPSDEREEFVKANHVEELSTRELDRLIKERDEALKEKQEREEYWSVQLEEQQKTYDVDMETARSAKAEAEERCQTAAEELKRAEQELEELRSRPVEVAVQAADPKELEAARKEAAAAAKKEAEDKLKKKIEQADQKRKDAEQELAKLKEKQGAAEERAKSAEEKAKETEERLRREREEADARQKVLARQLQTAGNSQVQTFRIYFEAAQENYNKMMGCLKKLELAGNAGAHNKMLDALSTLARTMLEKAPPRMEEAEKAG